MIIWALICIGCTMDYQAAHPTRPGTLSWVGKWVWEPENLVLADTVINSGFKYGGYWTWEVFRKDGFFSHIQAEGGKRIPEEWEKVEADTGSWRLILGSKNLLEIHREKCVVYNRTWPPNNQSWAVPCKVEFDTIQYRELTELWVRNRDQASERWRREE